MSTVNGFQVGANVLKYSAEALENYNTPDYSSSSTYAVGEYVMYQGKLYKCKTAITTAEAWTAAHWETAILSEDVSDLKSQITDNRRFARTSYDNIRTYTPTAPDMVNGSYNNQGYKTDSTTRLFFELPFTSKDFDYFQFTPGTKITGISYAFFNKETGTRHYDSDWQSGSQLVHVRRDCRIVFAFRKTGDAAVTPSDYDATLTYHSDITTDSAKISYVTAERLNYGTYTLTPLDLERGTYNSSGVLIDNNNRLRTRYKIPVSCGDIIHLTPATNITGFAIAYYNTSGTYVSNIEFSAAANTYVPVDGFCLIVLKPPTDVAMYPDRDDATVIITRSTHTDVKMSFERGAYDDDDITTYRYSLALSDYSGYLRNKYPILVGGADVFKVIGLPNNYSSSMVARFYDSNGAPVTGSKKSVAKNTLYGVPSGAYYMDFECPTFDYKSNDVYVQFFNGDGKQKEVKRIYTYSGNTIAQYFGVNDSINSGMSYKLPPNYSNTGDKVGLILWFAGNANYPNMNSGFANTYNPGIEYMRDEGYAVLQVFSWGSYYYGQYSDCGRDQPYPVPTCIECINKGIEYFVDRYNIDPDNIHIMSHSVGGIMSLFLASTPTFNIKSVGMFAPVVDFLSMRGRYQTTRRILAEELDFTGDTTDFFDINFDGSTETDVENYYFSDRCVPFWEDNFSELIRLNPAWKFLTGATATTKFNTAIADAQTWWADKTSASVYDDNSYEKMAVIPVKVWMAEDDEETPFLAVSEVIDQLQNGGSTAMLRSYASGGHSVYTLEKSTVTTALNITCTDIGSAWQEGIAWIRENTIK